MKKIPSLALSLFFIFAACQQTIDPFEINNCACKTTRKVFFDASNKYAGGYRYTYDNSGNILKEEGLLASDSTKTDPGIYKGYTYTNGVLTSITVPGEVWTVTTTNKLITKIVVLQSIQTKPYLIFSYTYNGNDLLTRVAKYFNTSTGALTYADSAVRTNYTRGRPRNLDFFYRTAVNSPYQQGNKLVLTFDPQNSLTQIDATSPNGTLQYRNKWTFDNSTKQLPENSLNDPYVNPNFSSLDHESFFTTSGAYTGFYCSQTNTDNYAYQVISKDKQGYPTKRKLTGSYSYPCDPTPSSGSYQNTATYYYDCCKK